MLIRHLNDTRTNGVYASLGKIILATGDKKKLSKFILYHGCSEQLLLLFEREWFATELSALFIGA